jgi:hypothetical protein
MRRFQSIGNIARNALRHLQRLGFFGAPLCLALVVFWGVLAPAQELDIPYEKFVLDNGLTLIVHEDHKAPIVAVNVWYHVGWDPRTRGQARPASRICLNI